MSETRYGWHLLSAERTTTHGRGKVTLPWPDGETRSMRGKLVLCERGFHAAKTIGEAVLQYGYGPVLCYVRVDGVQDEDETKFVGSSRTLVRSINVERELRLIAADVAERVLPLFEAQRPGDMRVRDCIAATRLFADGKTTQKELDAAWDAAMAARDAARAAWAARAAASTAMAAARDAARAASAAAWAAASTAMAAASDAEREWQKQHIEGVLLPLFADVMEAQS